MVHRHRSGSIGLTVLLLCALAGLAGPGLLLSAEEPAVDVNSPDALRHTLEQQTGKRVKIKLASGQDLDGKVAKVGSQALVLSELSGMEFFDATVRMDQVAAVLVKVRTK